MVAILAARMIGDFVAEHDLGVVLGEAGTLRVLPQQVRVPDVCFISWSKFPGPVLPAEPIPALAPDLAVEILSASNTPGEMQRKLHDYFEAGVRLVWYIDPEKRSALAYTAPELSTVVRIGESLSGGAVLPGLELPLRELFVR
jgi:Uma2 family endonuclease